MRRGKQSHGDFKPRLGVASLRRDFERVPKDEPRPKRLDFGWMSVPKMSSLDDVLPGSDVALRFIDGSTLVGHYITETAQRIRFRPWGQPERVFAKSEIVGARLLGAHSWAERQAIVKKQATGEWNSSADLPATLAG